LAEEEGEFAARGNILQGQKDRDEKEVGMKKQG
jgi:hypothetical protein